MQAYETFPRWDCTRAIRLQKCSTVQWRRPTPEVWVRKPAKCKYFTSVTHRSCCTRLLAKPFAANQKYAGSIAATHGRFSDVDEKWVRPSCVEISTHVKYPQVGQMTLPLCNISCASEQGTPSLKHAYISKKVCFHGKTIKERHLFVVLNYYPQNKPSRISKRPKRWISLYAHPSLCPTFHNFHN